jgi:hypothetical protein
MDQLQLEQEELDLVEEGLLPVDYQLHKFSKCQETQESWG